MHTCNCLVSIGGDLNNKAAKTGVTVPELMLLQLIHGPSAVSDITITGNPRIAQLDERDRLARMYSKHEQAIVGLWRDGGGKFATDIRSLNLNPALFAADRTAPYAGADLIEDREVEELKKAQAPQRRKRLKKSAKPVVPHEPEEEEILVDAAPGDFESEIDEDAQAFV